MGCIFSVPLSQRKVGCFTHSLEEEIGCEHFALLGAAWYSTGVCGGLLLLIMLPDNLVLAATSAPGFVSEQQRIWHSEVPGCIGGAKVASGES